MGLELVGQCVYDCRELVERCGTGKVPGRVSTATGQEEVGRDCRCWTCKLQRGEAAQMGFLKQKQWLISSGRYRILDIERSISV